jgi:hypothetical protein
VAADINGLLAAFQPHITLTDVNCNVGGYFRVADGCDATVSMLNAVIARYSYSCFFFGRELVEAALGCRSTPRKELMLPDQIVSVIFYAT